MTYGRTTETVKTRKTRHNNKIFATDKNWSAAICSNTRFYLVLNDCIYWSMIYEQWLMILLQKGYNSITYWIIYLHVYLPLYQDHILEENRTL